ncbi:hypothetical protein, partial [Pseudomonas sp. MPR-AND1A]|uniref:hypothetical protein n=2 Tax=unclassified Pseudomonas TaxID=196821 RepID=UPI001C446F9F
ENNIINIYKVSNCGKNNHGVEAGARNDQQVNSCEKYSSFELGGGQPPNARWRGGRQRRKLGHDGQESSSAHFSSSLTGSASAKAG